MLPPASATGSACGGGQGQDEVFPYIGGTLWTVGTEPGGGRGDREGSPRLPTSSSLETRKLCVLRLEVLAPADREASPPSLVSPPHLPGLRGGACAPRGLYKWRGRLS